jgi:ABC-2 type transport system permease protein
MEVHGLFIIYRISAQFFSGALVPVWFLPGALRTLADFLPFQAVIYLPTTIYLGGVPGPGILKVMALQLGWLVGLSLLARVMWLRAVRRVVVQGG